MSPGADSQAASARLSDFPALRLFHGRRDAADFRRAFVAQ